MLFVTSFWHKYQNFFLPLRAEINKNRYHNMKKVIFTAGLVLCAFFVQAQTPDRFTGSYIVKTNNVKTTDTFKTAEGKDTVIVKKTAHDFISDNFRFRSLCDWTRGMKFMVMPEKYDMVVNTFSDASNQKEVSSARLRGNIMTFENVQQAADGRWRMYFSCDDGKKYYFEIPSGSFDDYCYGKQGVPTLAYLDDVDRARELLKDKVLYTKAKTYYIDTESNGDGNTEYNLSKPIEVKVTGIGVGTRNFPVKIIVADKSGKEFFQNVTMSKTNCGMREDEFVTDNIKHTFYGSFELQDAIMDVLEDYNQYRNQIVHTKFPTKMLTRGDGRDRFVTVPKMTTFRIDNTLGRQDSPYVTLALTEMESRRQYSMEVTFSYDQDVKGQNDEKQKYFGYLFAMGEGLEHETSQEARAAIRQGRVIPGMSEDEVVLAMGEEPEKKVSSDLGIMKWYYPRSQKYLVIQFGRNSRVEKYYTEAFDAQKGAKKTAKKTAKKSSKK
jgi:hypothetical protein